MLNIIEIINLECSIGELILCSNNNVKTTYNISIVCKNFNEIVRNEMEKYITEKLLNKFHIIITNKMNLFCDDYHCINCTKKIREYNNELYLLSKKINIKIYDNIILNLKKVYYEYIFEENISNYCFETYLFGLIRKEYLKLINFLENNEEII
jgi:hypothetical protein